MDYEKSSGQTPGSTESYIKQPNYCAMRYGAGEPVRQAVLDRGRRSASLTIPSLLPPSGTTQLNQLQTPWQSLGAMGVKSLSSKIVMALTPPNTTFFRYMLEEEPQQQLRAVDPNLVTQVEKDLQEVERKVQRMYEGRMFRPKALEAMNQLIVAGNVLFYAKQGSQPKVYKIDSYVVTRDPYGQWLEVVVKETVAVELLDEEVKLACNIPQSDPKAKHDQRVDVYTCVSLQGDKFVQWQEINGMPVPGSDASYPKDGCPWLPLRMYSIDGEDYGRGYVEEFIGALAAYEAISQSMTENAKASARVLFGLPPTLRVDPASLVKKPNLSFIPGDLSKITTLRLEKNADFATTYQQLQNLERQLSQIFLLNASVQRDAERVTATEVEYMARQLEQMIGGIYSLLSDEFLLPLVKVLLKELEADGVMPQLPENFAQPTAITGLAALGRGNELDKLTTYLKLMADLQLINTVNTAEASERAALAIGLDTKGLVKSPQQIQAEQQQAMMQQMAIQAAPQVARNAGQAPVAQ